MTIYEIPRTVVIGVLLTMMLSVSTTVSSSGNELSHFRLPTVSPPAPSQVVLSYWEFSTKGEFKRAGKLITNSTNSISFERGDIGSSFAGTIHKIRFKDYEIMCEAIQKDKAGVNLITSDSEGHRFKFQHILYRIKGQWKIYAIYSILDENCNDPFENNG